MAVYLYLFEVASLVSCHVSGYQSICSSISTFPRDYSTVRNHNEARITVLVLRLCELTSRKKRTGKSQCLDTLTFLAQEQSGFQRICHSVLIFEF
jgi:hypothetical protein